MTDDLVETLKALEEQLLDPAVRHSSEKVASLISDDFVELGSSGLDYDKSQVVEGLAKERFSPGAMRSTSDFRCRLLADGVALLTYKALHVDASAETRTRRSSIWRLESGRWRLVFHQGTRIPS